MRKTRILHFPEKSRLIAIVLLLWIITACEKEKEEPIVITPTPIVRVLIASGGLGDMSYNDNIFRAVLEAQKEHNFQLEYVSPRTANEAETTFRLWKAEEEEEKEKEEEENNSRPYYTILAASEFEELARSIMSPAPVNNYLLFDTKAGDLPIPVFHFTGYGVSFLAGVAAYTQTKAEKAAYLGGQQHEAYIAECYEGFRDGYLYAGGKEVAETYLATTQEGFAMPQRAYEMADSLYKLYPFIYAMAGNSNKGIYQYLRDYPDGKYTAGVDVDQSAYSNQIIGSVIKEVDRCIKQYIALWMQGEKVPMREWYTLESGYVSFKIAEQYKSRLEQVIADHLPIAIKKEIEYEKTNATDARGCAVRLP